MFLQFLPAHLYKQVRVLAYTSNAFTRYTYHALFNGQCKSKREKQTRTDCLNSNDRHFLVLNECRKPNSMFVMYPACAGVLHYHDTHSFYFRQGAFSASIAAQIPIINMTVVEPTDSSHTLTIVFTQWVPPQSNVAPHQLITSDDYFAWRTKADVQTTVELFTKQCQEMYAAELQQLRLSKSSCSNTDFAYQCSRQYDSVITKYVKEFNA